MHVSIHANHLIAVVVKCLQYFMLKSFAGWPKMFWEYAQPGTHDVDGGRVAEGLP